MDRDTLEALRGHLRKFARERDWDQFHSPKNLACSISIEAGELLELFQWSAGVESPALSPELPAKAADEIADILFYLVLLADKLEIDLPSAIDAKLAKNAAKYPVDLSRGKSTKYTELES